MKLMIATLGTAAALMTATAASADYTYQDQYMTNLNGTTTGEAKLVSISNEPAGPSSDFSVEGVRQFTVFSGSDMTADALGPRGGR
ncbi:hypothetical protein [Rhodalgimonas zhirmunskyi]|uniref:Uncharacterized protein n=1 Tax=Rhodalgimonas zhirmunskyi TaxID=2964767 RepID=A0AAJ1UAW5_9RHOB|nr:hypothetical protein [Rhodoalgimonas zhirmunskyi]MDQ2095115.1 hypothetical protein [Rhodoalgimonas zhirmunskyi]